MEALTTLKLNIINDSKVPFVCDNVLELCVLFVIQEGTTAIKNIREKSVLL